MNFPTPVCPDRSAATGYAANTLDRMSEKRDDADFIEALKSSPEARAVVIVRDRPALRFDGGTKRHLFSLTDALGLGPARETALLGRDAEHCYFAILLDDSAAEMQETADETGMVDTRRLVLPGRPDIDLTDLRTIAVQGLVDEKAAGLLGQAKSLMYWHARHRFCSACGAPSVVGAAGWRRDCPACKAMHFPRTDPVVIMLAVDGDKCLMGRSGRFGKGMYSALAGFLEPGETIEEAVRREIKEESGIDVGRVHYVASQPWPFPSSLMIGCLAEATSRDIVIDKMELEDARWFTRDEIVAMLERRHPDGLQPPNPVAIAYHLVKAWVEMGA